MSKFEKITDDHTDDQDSYAAANDQQDNLLVAFGHLVAIVVTDCPGGGVVTLTLDPEGAPVITVCGGVKKFLVR
jgi:hypothetical protein